MHLISNMAYISFVIPCYLRKNINRSQKFKIYFTETTKNDNWLPKSTKN